MPGLKIADLKKRENFKIFKNKINPAAGSPIGFVKALPSGAPATTGSGKNKTYIDNIIIGYSNTSRGSVGYDFINSYLTDPDIFASHAKDLSILSSAHSSGTIVVPYYTSSNKTVQYMKLVEIWKEPAFGGAGGRSSTKKEDDALAKLNRDINQICKDNGIPHLNISYEGVKWKGIVGAKTVAGTPKSDFGLVNVADTIVCHISHKDGKTASKFSQWGGMTTGADGGGTAGVISKHAEVVQFVRDMHARYPVGSPAPTLRPALKRQIKSEILKLRAAYGPKCAGASYNGINSDKDCVDLILQGTNASLASGPEAGGISLKKTRGSRNKADYTISSDGHNMKMGNTTFGGQYEPVLMMLFKEATRKDFSVQGARFSIFTNGGRGTAIAEPTTKLERNQAGYGGNWDVKYGVSNWQNTRCECDVYPAFCKKEK